MIHSHALLSSLNFFWGEGGLISGLFLIIHAWIFSQLMPALAIIVHHVDNAVDLQYVIHLLNQLSVTMKKEYSIRTLYSLEVNNFKNCIIVAIFLTVKTSY